MAQDNGWFNPDQFSDPLNAECHEQTTAREIIDQMALRKLGPVHAFVAGVGTGATLIGVGRRLRDEFGAVRVVAVEPSESAVMSGGPPGAHGIAGIGDGFIPAIAGNGQGGVHALIDDVICVGTEDATGAARHLAEAHGFCVGVSSGANFLAAQRLREQFQTVVTVFADGYAKYGSVGLKHREPGRCAFERDAVVSPDKLA